MRSILDMFHVEWGQQDSTEEHGKKRACCWQLESHCEEGPRSPPPT